MVNDNGPRIGELFAGYGGLGMGVQAVYGGSIAWVSDIDKGANKILAHRFPGVPNHGDITRIDWSTVEPVDILTAGFPCQPVSNAGKQQGDKDVRWLWDHIPAAIRVLRPGLVVLENVRGLFTADGGRLFGGVLGDLAACGYDTQWVGVRAAAVGAPHGRFRVFITAHARGEHGGQWGESAPRQAASGRALGELAGRSGVGTGLTGALLPTPAVNDIGEGKTLEWWDEWTAKMRATHGNGNGHGPSLAIETQRLAAGEQWGKYAAAIHRWEALTRPAPPPTEAGPKGNPRLSPRFSEFLMGLPDGWVTDVPDITRAQALKALGNGVVPQQAAHALHQLHTIAATYAPVGAA